MSSATPTETRTDKESDMTIQEAKSADKVETENKQADLHSSDSASAEPPVQPPQQPAVPPNEPARAPAPEQNLIDKHPTLVDLLFIKPLEDSNSPAPLDKGNAEVPKSPSKMKRASDPQVPESRPPVSPTKKLKSPSKK